MQNATSIILGGTYRKVLVTQAVVVLGFAALALVWQGQIAAVSALFGGLIIIVGNLAYAFIARPSKVKAQSGNQVLLRHVLAEVAKILFVLGLMLFAFSAGKFDAVWLIAAVGVALLGHGLSLLLSK
jgi:F0F1-type ATP synthase assembly protein I